MRKKFEFLYCPFEGRADMHHKIQFGTNPNLSNVVQTCQNMTDLHTGWLVGQCHLVGGSKGHAM